MTPSRFSGDAVEDFERARQLIALHPRVDLGYLMTVAADTTAARSSRLAAIYVLGFVDDRGVALAVLERIGNSSTEPEAIRDMAQDAVDAIRNPR